MKERRTIGHYRILQLLGSGGMGTVYEAEQENPRRVVALKVLRSGMNSQGVRRRFEIEAEVLGNLHHRGIAQVYEAAVHREDDEEIPFFAMELVREALPITEYARRNLLPIRRRVALFREVLDAVHHGHQNAVIHRDLKPDNILVGRDGQPKVIDFGVARVTQADVQAVTMQTEVGQLVGTLYYMSPEQCAGDSRLIDSRSDVYSLGVVLYEMLTHVMPYTLEGKTFFEMSRTIQEHPPRRFTDIPVGLSRDLETILRKALEKDPERRYASASEFAEDLRRFLAREPISARPPSVPYQLAMFARRHRVLVTAVSIALVAVVIGMVGTVLGFLEARHERNVAREAETEVRAASELLAARGEELQHQAYVAGMAAASGALAVHDVATVRRLLERSPEELRDWEWHYLASHLDECRRSIAGHPYGITSVVVHPGGQRAWSLGFDSELHEWNVNWEGRELRAPETPVQNFRRLALHPEGHTLVVPGSTSFRVLRVLDGRTDLVKEHPFVAYGTSYRSDGSRIAAALGARVAFLDGGSGEMVDQLPRDFRGAIIVAWSPDGRTLAVPEFDPEAPYLSLWDVAMMEEKVRLPLAPTQIVTDVEFHPLRDEISCSLTDGSILRYSLQTSELLSVIDRHDDVVSAIAFSCDGEWLASASIDRAVRLFDASTGRLVRKFVGHEDGVTDVVFHPDGKQLVSTSIDRTLRTWDLPANEPRPSIPFGRGVLGVCDSGRLFGGHYISGEIFLWTAERGEVRAPWGRVGRKPRLSFSPGTEKVAVYDGLDTLRIGPPFQWERYAEIPLEGDRILVQRFSPDGRYLVTGQQSGLYFRDVESGVVEFSWLEGSQSVRSLAWNENANLLIFGNASGMAHVVKLPERELVARFRASPGPIVEVALVDADTKAAVVGENADGTYSLSLWSLDGELVQQHIQRVGQRLEGTHVAVSPGGSRFALFGLLQSQVTLFDSRTGFPVLALPGRSAFAVPAGCFLGATGGAIVTCDVNGQVYRFEAPGFGATR